MNEAKIREIVEKVISDNMPNKDEITQKAIEAVKEAEKKENDKPWLIKKGETYWEGSEGDEMFWYSAINNATEEDKLFNLQGFIARTKNELREIIKARKMQREYEQWCMEYPVDWENGEQPKYFAYYCHKDKEIEIDNFWCAQDQATVYCSNKTHIRAFIDKVGEPNFIKYVMGIGLPKYFLEV